MEVAVIYYGGHLVISNQMRSGDLIAFILYVLELAECLEVLGFAPPSAAVLPADAAPSSRASHPSTRG